MQTAFLDRDRAIAELAGHARQLVLEDARVIAVGLFGSLARGEALPSSDADLLIVLQSHRQSRWFDRIPEYSEAFRHTALPVEPFPYTVEELSRLLAQPGFLQTGMRELMPLAGSSEVWANLRHLSQSTDR